MTRFGYLRSWDKKLSYSLLEMEINLVALALPLKFIPNLMSTRGEESQCDGQLNCLAFAFISDMGERYPVAAAHLSNHLVPCVDGRVV